MYYTLSLFQTKLAEKNSKLIFLWPYSSVSDLKSNIDLSSRVGYAPFFTGLEGTAPLPPLCTLEH